MPSLGADMEVGTIVEWKVKVGDTVHRGDIVAVVDTEKSTIEVEIFEDGVIEEILVEPEVEVPVGTPLARIAPAKAASEPVTTPSPPVSREFARATPRARREAAKAGIDLSAVTGTGPGGAVTGTDLLARASTMTAQPAKVITAPARRAQAGSRGAIASLMARSKREVPHYYLSTTIDLRNAMAWLDERNASCGVEDRILPIALLLRAIALGATEVPAVNGFWRDEFQPSADVHLGVAISLRNGGLVAPAIRNADKLGVADLMAALRDLVGRARSGALRSSDVADPTITVTNLGDQGVEAVFGVIYPPQVAMVGLGRIVSRPWADAGMIGIRPVVTATLSADHRASDGHGGARFLAAIDRLLQKPEEL